MNPRSICRSLILLVSLGAVSRADSVLFVNARGHSYPVAAATARSNLVVAQSGVATGATTPGNGGGTAPAFTGTAMAHAGFVAYPGPIASELITIVADALAANGAQVIAGQPAVPVKLNVRVVDAGNNVTAGNVTVVGVGPGGSAVTEGPTDLSNGGTGGTRTLTTSNAFATVTSVTIAAFASSGGTPHFSVGQSTSLGLPIPAGAASVVVYKAAVGATIASTPVNETVGTTDATARTIVPTTAPDGTKAFSFWFSYLVTPAGSVASHVHTGASHTHTQN